MSGIERDIIFESTCDCKCKSKIFIETLPNELTIRKNLPIDITKQFMGYSCETIFKEVSINKYSPTQETEIFLNTPIQPINDLSELYEEIKKAVYNTWDCTKVHILGHSSGYDSRLLSYIIKELTIEHGQDWMGKVYCVEVLGEESNFKRIMQTVGLDGIIYNEGIPAQAKHSYSFKFDTFWQKFNGIVSYPVNVFYDAYRYLSEQGMISKNNIQYYTGYGATESMDNALAQWGFAYYYKFLHHLQVQYFRQWGGEWTYPYWQWNVQKAIRGCIKWKDSKERLAKLLADQIIPWNKTIPRIDVKELKQAQYMTIDDTTLKQIERDYNRSWYGGNVPIKLTNNIGYNLWSFHYCVASLCEHLLEQGYKIKFI